MFTRKQKIVFGLFFCLFASWLQLSPSTNSVLAAPVTPGTFTGAIYTVTSLCTSDNTKPASVNVTIDGRTYNFVDNNPCDNDRNLKYYGNVGFICDQTNNPTNYGIEITGGPTAFQGGSRYQATIQVLYSTDTAITCSNSSNNANLNPVSITLYHNVQNPPTPSDTPPAGPTGPVDECKRGSITSFEWWACPLLEGLDSIAQNLTDIIEGLLFFETANTSDDSYEGVYRAWNLFRYIASIILVIVMFVMVISQAISMGPFDAYTVRKLLPKLLAAAILIQLSWPFCIFVIEVFNDLGRGIADLMMFPFGGADALTLDDSLGEVMGGTSTIQGVGILAILIVGGVLAALNIFLLLAVFVGIVFSLFIGFLVLVVRKMLLIVLIMTAPVALALWILPGTKKYWDLWQSTFIGLLMMFPIIMALIASGRILANIVAGGGGFGGASLSIQALNAILVLVVFFAPFWLIPKTFSWGGRAFANVAGTVNNRSKGIIDRPTKHMRERQGQYNQYRRGQAAARLTNPTDQYTGRRFGWGRVRRTLDRAATGRLDPTLMGPGMADERRKQVLEEAQLGAAARMGQATHEAQMASIPAAERKKMQDFANTEVADMNDVGALVALAQNGTREQRIAATGKLLDMRRFDDVINNNLVNNNVVNANGQQENIYEATLATRPELFGMLSQTRADMLAPANINRGAAHTLGGGDGQAGTSVGQLATQHQSFFNAAATEFEQPNPTPENQAALDGAVARIQELARSTQGRSIVGSEAETHINRILEEQYRRQNNLPPGTQVQGQAPTYQSHLP